MSAFITVELRTLPLWVESTDALVAEAGDPPRRLAGADDVV
jgi:hypothetical protein